MPFNAMDYSLQIVWTVFFCVCPGRQSIIPAIVCAQPTCLDPELCLGSVRLCLI